MAVTSSTKGDSKEETSKGLTEGNASTVTPEMLKALKESGLLEEIKEDLKKELKSHSLSTTEETYSAVDDYLDVPSVFFSFSTYFAIHSDKRYGEEMLPPRNEAIKFQKLYRYETKDRRQGSRASTTISISQAIIRSQTQVDWLKSHSQFGIKFFETIDSAKNVDIGLAEKMAQWNAVISQMGDLGVIERAKREGVDISDPDIVYMRQRLVRVLAEKDLKTESSKRVQRIKGGKRDENNREIKEGKVSIDKDTEQQDAVYA